jgi:hypothetical protein
MSPVFSRQSLPAVGAAEPDRSPPGDGPRGEINRDKLLRIHGVSAVKLARRLSGGPTR